MFFTSPDCNGVSIMSMEGKYYLSDENDTTFFVWGDSYKNRY